MTAVPPEAAAGSSPAVIPTATASANTNIALIKYWGKVDEVQAIPATSSLSLTLGGTRTTTTVSFDGGDGAADSVTINGSASSSAELTRVSRFLDLVRSRSGITAAATVISRASVPLAAGLASSAAGFAALAAAASRAAGMDPAAKSNVEVVLSYPEFTRFGATASPTPCGRNRQSSACRPGSSRRRCAH